MSLFLTGWAIETIIDHYFHQTTFTEVFRDSPSCYEPSDVNVYRLRKNYDCVMTNHTKEFTASAHINSLGHRGKEFSPVPDNGTIRILALGDSMTFGYGLADEDTYPHQLQTHLSTSVSSPVEVINAGFADGFSPDSYYVYLKTEGLNMKPDHILLNLFVWNDVSDLKETVWDRIDAYGLPDAISLCCAVIDAHRWRKKIPDLKYRFPLLRESQIALLTTNVITRLNTPTRGTILLPQDATYTKEYERFSAVIGGIARLAQERNIPLTVVLLPFDTQVMPDRLWRYGYITAPGPNDYLQTRLKNILSSHGITALDLLPVFLQHTNEQTSFPQDQHWNATGANIAAQAVAATLQEKLHE